MSLEEIKQLLFIVKSAYKKYYESYTTQDFQNLATVWALVLKKYSYEDASQGLASYLASDKKGFPPSIGQLVDCIEAVIHPPDKQLGALEAWAMVKSAVRNSTYHSKEEFENLPKDIQAVIGSSSVLYHMAQSICGSVEQSHFIRQYNEHMRWEAEKKKLPDRIGSTEQERIGVQNERINVSSIRSREETKRADGEDFNNAKKVVG